MKYQDFLRINDVISVNGELSSWSTKTLDIAHKIINHLNELKRKRGLYLHNSIGHSVDQLLCMRLHIQIIGVVRRHLKSLLGLSTTNDFGCRRLFS